jgi:chromate reductase, NAD(P)H dehydrogenase (quinone)
MAASNSIQILAISGSLRATSPNATLLRAAIQLAPENIEIILYQGLGELPHFNPDLEDTLLSSMTNYRESLQKSDGVLISSPEYAHGIPGVLMNALDWVVGSGEFVGKPVALFNGSPRATYAQASLLEVLTTMDARMITEASITLPLLGSGLDEAGIIAHAEFADALRLVIASFTEAIKTLQTKTN